MTVGAALVRQAVQRAVPQGGILFEAPVLPSLQLALNTNLSRRTRQDCRSGALSGPTANLAPGFLQANLVVVERRFANDFLTFTQKNPKACPLLDVISGKAVPESILAPDSDIRCDLPRYRIWQRGKMVEERANVKDIWPNDAVGFLLGCSFSFENDLKSRGLLTKTSSSVPMYRTTVPNERSGPFQGNLVVSMRMVEQNVLTEVIQVTERHSLAHGGPVAIGYSGQKELGIKSLEAPDFGEVSNIVNDGSSKVPVFWACGVTPQTAIEDAKDQLGDSIVITHAPGCMFITDVMSSTSYV